MKKVILRITALVMALSFLFGILGATANSQGAVLAANKTEVLVDGQPIPGLKGFTYKVYKDRQDVREIGENEIITEGSLIYNDDQIIEVQGIGLGLNAGIGASNANLHVKGKILVYSNSELSELLDQHMQDNTCFQIVLQTEQTSYPESLGTKKITFDGVHVDDREFTMDTHGYGLTTYTFTADRIREE